MGRYPGVFAILPVTTYPPLTPVNQDHRLLSAFCGLPSAERTVGVCYTAPREAGMTAAARPEAADFPIRQGEQRWTEAEIAELFGQLSVEAAELRAEIARAESGIAERLGDAVSDAGDDQADIGAKAFEREHELALTYNARELLAQTERAIARIEAGTYGSCESCGEPIGKARLQAFPRATLCVS
jgi:DnaK suppressor protein